VYIWFLQVIHGNNVTIRIIVQVFCIQQIHCMNHPFTLTALLASLCTSFKRCTRWLSVRCEWPRDRIRASYCQRILGYRLVFFSRSLTTSFGMKKLPPDFLVSSANCSKRYSNASPKLSVLSRSSLRKRGEAVNLTISFKAIT